MTRNRPRDLSPPTLMLRGLLTPGAAVPLAQCEPGRWTRHKITVQGSKIAYVGPNDGKGFQNLPEDAPARGALGLLDVGGEVEFANIYVRDM